MRRRIVKGHELLTDGRRFWVNGPDGAAVARYSPSAGRDVHRPLSEQQEAGECLDCAPDTCFSAFAASVAKHYGITIPRAMWPLPPKVHRDRELEQQGQNGQAKSDPPQRFRHSGPEHNDRGDEQQEDNGGHAAQNASAVPGRFAVPVARLAPWSPFTADVWGHGKLTKKSVAAAIRAGRLRTEVWDLTFAPGAAYHAERVAFLVVNRDETPIEIDVGVPVLGFHESWIIHDGHHRLAAALYCGDETIAADVSGQMDVCGSDARDQMTEAQSRCA